MNFSEYLEHLRATQTKREADSVYLHHDEWWFQTAQDQIEAVITAARKACSGTIQVQGFGMIPAGRLSHTQPLRAALNALDALVPGAAP